MMSHWQGTIIGPGHVSIAPQAVLLLIAFILHAHRRCVDRAREPHLQSQDCVRRELPRLPPVCPVHF